MRRSALTALLIVLLLLATAPIFFYRLGRSGLGDPDEGRNAEAGREIRETGDWVTPRLNEARYLDKPPAFFWTLAVSYGFLGANEFAARLPSALFALAGIGLLGWFACRHAGWSAGFTSGLILALTPLYMIFGRLVIFDMMLNFCMMVSALAAFEALEGAPAVADPGAAAGRRGATRPGRRAAILFFAAAGVGTITKGPVAFVVPFLVAVAWALLRGRPRLLGRLRWGLGGLIYAAIVVPWLSLAAVANPGYLEYAVVGENLRRMSSNMFETARPFYFYLKIIIPGLFPWILYAAASAGRRLLATTPVATRRPGFGWLRGIPGRLRRWRADVVRETSTRRLVVLFAALWLAVLILFFSSIASKRPSYMLPCAAPLALFTGCLWAEAFRGGRRAVDILRGEAGPGAAFEAAWRGEANEARRDLGLGAGIAAAGCAVGSIAVLLAGPLSRALGSGEGEYGRMLSRHWLFVLTALALLATAGLLVLVRRHPRPAASFVAAALSIAVMVPLARAATGHVDAARSSRPVSAFLAGRLGRDDVLVCFEQYRPGLNFYLKRWLWLVKGRMSPVKGPGTPFTSNYMKYHLEEFQGDPSFRMIDYAGLRHLLGDASRRVFILAPRQEYDTLRAEAQGLLNPDPVWEDIGAGLFARAGDAGR